MVIGSRWAFGNQRPNTDAEVLGRILGCCQQDNPYPKIPQTVKNLRLTELAQKLIVDLNVSCETGLNVTLSDQTATPPSKKISTLLWQSVTPDRSPPPHAPSPSPKKDSGENTPEGKPSRHAPSPFKSRFFC